MVTLAWPIVALRDKLSDPVVFWFCQFAPQVRRRVDVQIETRTWTVGTLAHMTTLMGARAPGPKCEDVRSVAEQCAVINGEVDLSCTTQSCSHAAQKPPR